MIPQRIRLQNFLSYGECELDLRGVQLACFSGPNGAGKSNIIDSLTWGIFGEARGRTEDDLFRTGTSDMAVEVEFSVGDSQYRVARRRKRRTKAGQTALDFDVRNGGDGWRKLTGATIRDTQAVINRTIGCDYDTFINASLLLQGRADEFARKPPAERKQVLGSILRLDSYDRLQDLAKQRRNLADAEISNLRAWLEDTETKLQEQPSLEEDLQVSDRQLTQIRKDMLEAETELGGQKDKFATLKERRRLADEASDRLSNLHDRERKAQVELDEERKRHTAATSALSGAADIEARYQRHQELRQTIDQLRASKNEREALQQRLDGRREHLERLKPMAPDLATVKDCPVCQQALDETAKAAVHEHYTDVYASIEGLQVEIARLEAELATAPSADGLEEIEAEYASLGGAVDRYTELGAARERLTAIKDTISRLESELGTVAEDILGAQEAADATTVDEEAFRSLSESVSILEDRLTGLRDSERRIGEVVASLRQRLSDLEELRQQRDERKNRFDEAAAEAQVYADLATACGKGGVQALIIDSAIPEIAQIANDALDQLTSGRMSLTMSTQRLTQAGATRETLDIEIGDESGTRAYEMFSGGERFRVDFALHLALAQVLARRAGAPLQLLVIDEGFGSQDEEGRARLLEALTLARQRFAMVLAITHIDEFREAFPVRIEVRPSANGSTASIV